MDVRLLDAEGVASAAPSDVRLHLLQLAPIKAQLGEHWPRMADLVHAQFEKGLQRARGPSDHYIKLDELCYVATFHGSSPEEAALICAGIAREVCEHLFGQDARNLSFRDLVGRISLDELRARGGGDVSDFLHRTGAGQAAARALPLSETETSASDLHLPGHAMIDAHRFLERAGRALRLFPLWDLKKRSSSVLFLSPLGLSGGAYSLSGSGQNGDNFASNLELRLLRAAGEHAQRIHAAQKVCAVGASVSYETLSCFAGRVRYITALREVRTTPECPLLLKIEDIPQGVNLGRLGEIMHMVTMPNVRFLLEFSERIPEMDFQMGAAGIGAVLPDGCSTNRATALLQSLSQRLTGQHAFGFMRGLHSVPLMDLAEKHNLRFGMGAVLDRGHLYTGLEPLPDFPLSHE